MNGDEAQSGAGPAPVPAPAGRYVVLDSLRGVCALAVALFHYPVVSDISESPLVRHAFLFVDFFFVLSGFVIAKAYDGRLTDGSSRLGFLIRRVGRVWPLHVALLAVIVAVSLAKGEVGDEPRHSAVSILTNLLLVHSLGVHHVLTWNTPSWSISVEAFLYVAFVALSPLRRRLWVYGAIVPASLAMLALAAPYGMESTYDFGVFRGLAGFFLGAIVARLPVRRLPTWLEAVTLTVVAAWVAVGPFQYVEPLLFGAAVWVFAGQGGWISRILALRPFARLGEWSYSIYMVHTAVVAAFWVAYARLGLTPRDGTWLVAGDPLSANLWAVPYLAVVIGVSALTYRFIESPARRIFNRWAHSAAPPPAAPKVEIRPSGAL